MTDAAKPSPRARRSGVQSVEIGGELLEAMVAIGAPAPLSDISRAAGMSSAKAHRYLTSLCETGLATQHADTGRYGLGPLALRMGLSAIAQHDVIERAYEALVALCDEFRTSGHLSVWSEGGPVVIRSAHGGPPVISPVAVGTVLPLARSASGLVYLSFMPEAATREALRRQVGPNGVDDAAIAQRREAAAKAGFAIASGQFIPGLCAIASPIRNHDGTLAGAITLVSTDADLFTENSRATRRVLAAMEALHQEWSPAAR